MSGFDGMGVDRLEELLRGEAPRTQEEERRAALFAELRGRREEVEMMLCLGADYQEASEGMLRNAIRAGMIPSINSMMGVGIVFLPGMMTGQILAGADPLTAIRYQIVVMLMLVGSTAIGSLTVTLLVRRLCFGAAHELKLGR